MIYNIMDCLLCNNKQCKSASKDCNSARDKVLPLYHRVNNKKMYLDSDKLVAGGKAGQLSRLDEIAELAISSGYQNIAIAYCYCMEDLALDVKNFLKKHSIRTSSYRCTINGIKETQISEELADSVNCNPIGQATAINRSKADFVIEMGLCLGHDILFHKYLKKPFSTFIVKDRVHNHNPANALESYQDTNTQFIENYLDDKMGMKPSTWLKEQINNKEKITIIDLRAPKAFKEDHIEKSINIPLSKLPKQYNKKLKDKSQNIIFYCNGSVQSAYAIMFLYSKGYKNVFNLSGGFSSWKKF